MFFFNMGFDLRVWWGRGGVCCLFSGIPAPADPKAPALVLFEDIHFWLTDPKGFQKAPLASICNNFFFGGGGVVALAERRRFLQKISKKCLNCLFGRFFSKIYKYFVSLQKLALPLEIILNPPLMQRIESKWNFLSSLRLSS